MVSFHATVTNTGDAVESSFTLAVALSATPQFTPGTLILLGNTTIDQGLAPGQSMIATVTDDVIPASTAVGGYYLGAEINYTSGNITQGPGAFVSPGPGVSVTPPTPAARATVTIGGLNAGFGSGGVVRQTTGLSTTTAIAQQTDGKTLAIGECKRPRRLPRFRHLALQHRRLARYHLRANDDQWRHDARHRDRCH